MPCVGGRTFNFFSNLFAFLIIFRNFKSFDLFKTSQNIKKVLNYSAKTSRQRMERARGRAVIAILLRHGQQQLPGKLRSRRTRRENLLGNGGEEMLGTRPRNRQIRFIQKTELHKTLSKLLFLHFFCISRVLARRYTILIVFLKKSIFEITVLLKKKFGFF